MTAGLAFGGETTEAVNSTEEYDGTDWTAGGNMGTARYQFCIGGAGTQTAGLADGGLPNVTTVHHGLQEEL